MTNLKGEKVASLIVQEISKIEEPMLKANLFTPPEYAGAIMELCTNKRGVCFKICN